jgi:hypothetical protein
MRLSLKGWTADQDGEISVITLQQEDDERTHALKRHLSVPETAQDCPESGLVKPRLINSLVMVS